MSTDYLRELHRLTSLNDEKLNPVHEAFRVILKQSWAELNGYEPGETLTLSAPSAWYDHAITFKQALVLQPYAHVGGCDWPVFAALARKGFQVHFPPNPLASFHYPGATLFIVITPLGNAPPQWLSAQLRFMGGAQ